MTDEPALLAAVRARPDDDTPRLVYADWLDDHAGTVPCPACRGNGHLTRHAGTPDAVSFPDPQCVGCQGVGAVPNGLAVRAAFIRAQVERARTPHNHKHQVLGGPVDGCPACQMVKPLQDAWHAIHKSFVPPGFVLRHLSLRPLNVTFTRHGSDPIVATPARGFLHAVACRAADWLEYAAAILAAHPVRRVRLTTSPGMTPGWPAIVRAVRPGDPHYDPWPGVTFELPPSAIGPTPSPAP